MDPLVVPRLATSDDAEVVARLLFDFNAEFDTPSPPPSVLAPRLRGLLRSGSTYAVVAGTPPIAVGLVTMRSNVWFDGSVGLLDELYVVPDRRSHGVGTAVMGLVASEGRRRGVELLEINVDAGDTAAQRFYERLGFSGVEEDTGERAYYYAREL